MTKHDILDAIGDIDPAYLAEAKRKPVIAKFKWIGVTSLAACLILMLVIPVCYQYFFLKPTDVDYAPIESNECSVYFVQDGELNSESVDVLGGDAEMFQIWAIKNSVKETIDLKDISFAVSQSESDLFDVLVTVPVMLSHYFQDEDGDLLLDSLKKTIASYRNIEIGVLSITYL